MIELTTLAAWRWTRQMLASRAKNLSCAEILERTGWVRSVGGASPYLALFARGGHGREAVDAAVSRLEIHELPAVRGCTYVVSASDFALALRAGRLFGGDAEIAAAKKHLGVTEREVERLCTRVIDALAAGPLDPAALKEATGDAVRHLGDAGKKRGVTTTLPLALGRLQGLGDLRRVPTNGRLDQQRYRYALWRPNPLQSSKLDDRDVPIELARRFFAWAAPAPLTDFATWSGLGVRACKAAIEPLNLATLRDTDWLIAPEALAALESFAPGAKQTVSLVGNLDNTLHLRRDMPELLDPAHRALKVHGEKSLEELGGLADLPTHAILANGRLIGLWDFDVASQSVVSALFPGVTVETTQAVAETERYVREQLGDARAFSLDSPESRVARIAWLRKPGWKRR